MKRKNNISGEILGIGSSNGQVTIICIFHNRCKLTDEKPTNLSRLNPSKREYPRLNTIPQKARKNLVNHAITRFHLGLWSGI